MKKAFLLLIAVMALAGTARFNVSASENGTVNAIVYSEFFTDVNAGDHVSAEFYTSNAELQELTCAGTENPGFVSCQFPEEYTGQQIPMQLTKNGVMFVYVVNVPAK